MSNYLKNIDVILVIEFHTDYKIYTFLNFPSFPSNIANICVQSKIISLIFICNKNNPKRT